MDRYDLLVACRSGEVNWIVVALLLRSGDPSLWEVVKVSWLVTALLLRTGGLAILGVCGSIRVVV